MRIPVVFATDENYLFFVMVAISSMAQSAGENTSYKVYILVNDSFEDKEDLLEKLSKRYANIEIVLLRIDSDIFKNAIINNSHVTKATFYRLILSDLMEEEKCIYLDADIIVTEDLSELYNIDLEDKYVGGCRDIWIDLLTEEKREIRREQTGIVSMDQYINAGVLLLNLKSIREDGMNKVFLEHLKKDYPYEDQDILNVCCYGRIKRLPAKWNIFTFFMGQVDAMIEAGVSTSVIDIYNRQHGIIHYATPWIRPWERSNSWGSHLWWQVADLWSEELDYKKRKDYVIQKEKTVYWKHFIEECKKYKQVVIFGYTYYGRVICDYLCNADDELNIVFYDNDEKKHGQVYRGAITKNFKEERIVSGEDFYIIASQKRAEEVKMLLLEHGVKEEQMVCYKYKPWEYYFYLDKYFYLDEAKDIFLREGIEWKQEYDMDSVKEILQSHENFERYKGIYQLSTWMLKE